jgi:hypothetical protein
MKKNLIQLGLVPYTLGATSIAMCMMSGCAGESAPVLSSSESSVSSSDTSSAQASAPKKPKVQVNLEEIKAAKKLISGACSQLSAMMDDGAFDRSITGKDNFHGILDVKAVNKAIATIAVLPDNGENQFVQPVSVALAKIREAMELYEKSLASAKPFSDGSGNGPKMAGLASEYQLQLMVGIDESLKITENK